MRRQGNSVNSIKLAHKEITLFLVWAVPCVEITLSGKYHCLERTFFCQIFRDSIVETDHHE